MPSSTEYDDSQAWQQLAKMLTACDASSGVHRIFPTEPEFLSFLDALDCERIYASPALRDRGRQIHQKMDGLLKQLAIFKRVSHCPVVAITGLLNAGKSSLLATYLSASGRSRVLRGVGNLQGTHRFVIWLPKLWWSDPELLNSLISLMCQIFGHPPEQLSDDPAVAQEQYNGKVLFNLLTSDPSTAVGKEQSQPQPIDPMSIPLIACDSALDELKLGLVDCPDIQTGFTSTTQSGGKYGGDLATSRREHLARIGRLCSAFVVVSRMSSLQDEGLLQLLTTLRDAMPGVPRILAINKVKARYTAEVVAKESRALIDRFSIASVFAAYDYRSSLASGLIPPAPKGLVCTQTDPQPIFFSLGVDYDSRLTTDSASPIASNNIEYLYHLSSRLDAGSLAIESHRSLSLQLQSTAAEGLEWFNANRTARNQQVAHAWQAIADACYDFMAERDASGQATGLRLQASPAIVGQLADSLQRTAPSWMRLSMAIDRTARQFQQAVSNSAARFKILQSASNTVLQFAKGFKRGEGAQVVTPQRLAEAIRKCDLQDSLAVLDESSLLEGCEAAMKRFAAEDKTQLDAKELDNWSREIWANMPLKQKLWKGAQPLAVMMGPLLAAVLVPFDGGGSAVLVFASLKELLAAAGIAALMTPALGGGEALKIVHRETPWRQLSDLFAMVCDCLNMARPVAGQLPKSFTSGEHRQLLSSSQPIKLLDPRNAVLSQWQSPDDFIRVLRSTIQNSR